MPLVPTLTADSLAFASTAGPDLTARKISMIALVPLVSMAPPVTIESAVSSANALQVKPDCCAIWMTLALQILVTPEPFVIRVLSMALTCAHVPTATKVLTVPKILTNAKPVHHANTTDSASTLLAHFDVIALVASLVLDAKLTSTNAIPTLAKMMALASMNVALSAVSACQATLESIAKLTSTNALPILASMAAPALT